MAAVGQKLRRPMMGFRPTRIERGHWYRRAAAGGHAVQAWLREAPIASPDLEQQNTIPIPGAGVKVDVRQRFRYFGRHVHLFELAVAEKGEKSAVGCPERLRRSSGSAQLARGGGI